jgi:hypothetical protein
MSTQTDALPTELPAPYLKLMQKGNFLTKTFRETLAVGENVHPPVGVNNLSFHNYHRPVGVNNPPLLGSIGILFYISRRNLCQIEHFR